MDRPAVSERGGAPRYFGGDHMQEAPEIEPDGRCGMPVAVLVIVGGLAAIAALALVVAVRLA